MGTNKHKLSLIITAFCLTATMLTGCENPVASTADTKSTVNTAYNITDNEDYYSDEYSSDTREETSPETSAVQPQLPDESKIVRDVNAQLTSRNFDEADKKLCELIKQYSARTMNDSYRSDYETHELSAHDVYIRVTSEKLDAFIDAIKSEEIWSIDSLNISADDLGDSYQTNKEQIESLRLRYNFYKQQAETADTEEAIQSWTEKMLDTLTEIETLENQNKQIDVDVAYSTVSISLTKDIGAEKLNTSTGVGQTLIDTLTMLPTNILSAFGYLLIIVMWILPWAIIIALIVLLIRFISKKYRETHPKTTTPQTHITRKRKTNKTTKLTKPKAPEHKTKAPTNTKSSDKQTTNSIKPQ